MIAQSVSIGGGPDSFDGSDPTDRSIGDTPSGNRLIPDPRGGTDNLREEL